VEEPVYIICPGCECAVREISATPCPNCRRCPFCGQKWKNEDRCNCGYDKDPERLASFKAKWAIPAHNVPRERRRMEIRKQLETKQIIVGTLLVVPWIFVGIILRDLELFGPKTVANFWGMVIGTLIVMLSASWSVDKVFRRIKNRRLEAEFPSEKSRP
jgi:hypothetical protein